MGRYDLSCETRWMSRKARRRLLVAAILCSAPLEPAAAQYELEFALGPRVTGGATTGTAATSTPTGTGTVEIEEAVDVPYIDAAARAARALSQTTAIEVQLLLSRVEVQRFDIDNAGFRSMISLGSGIVTTPSIRVRYQLPIGNGSVRYHAVLGLAAVFRSGDGFSQFSDDLAPGAVGGFGIRIPAGRRMFRVDADLSVYAMKLAGPGSEDFGSQTVASLTLLLGLTI